MPFTGRNQFFDAKTTLSVTNGTKKKKAAQKHAIKEGLPVFRCYYFQFILLQVNCGGTIDGGTLWT